MITCIFNFCLLGGKTTQGIQGIYTQNTTAPTLRSCFRSSPKGMPLYVKTWKRRTPKTWLNDLMFFPISWTNFRLLQGIIAGYMFISHINHDKSSNINQHQAPVVVHFPSTTVKFAELSTPPAVTPAMWLGSCGDSENSGNMAVRQSQMEPR